MYPGLEHVVGPDDPALERGHQKGDPDSGLSVYRPSAEDRYDVTHRHQTWYEEDVDLWMAEEPEEVRPKQWPAFSGGVEDGAEEPVSGQQDQGRHESGEGP